jgi:hypothetical protein
MDRTAELVGKFVTALNRRGLEPLFDREVPQDLRTREVTDMPDMFEWEIRPASDTPWLAPLETRLPSPFPSLYRFLITHFKFAEFEVGPIMFFANTGQKDIFNDISRALFSDEGMYPVLLKNGLMQFGRQAGGGYDPMCFDMKARRKDDAPIVQVDHEDILIRNRVRVVKDVAPSFREFVERFIAGEFPPRR